MAFYYLLTWMLFWVNTYASLTNSPEPVKLGEFNGDCSAVNEECDENMIISVVHQYDESNCLLICECAKNYVKMDGVCVALEEAKGRGYSQLEIKAPKRNVFEEVCGENMVYKVTSYCEEFKKKGDANSTIHYPCAHDCMCLDGYVKIDNQCIPNAQVDEYEDENFTSCEAIYEYDESNDVLEDGDGDEGEDEGIIGDPEIRGKNCGRNKIYHVSKYCINETDNGESTFPCRFICDCAKGYSKKEKNCVKVETLFVDMKKSALIEDGIHTDSLSN